MSIYLSKTLSGHLQELKNKEKVQLGNPKVVTVAYETASLQSLIHSSNGAKVVINYTVELVTYEIWSQGQLQLYLLFICRTVKKIFILRSFFTILLIIIYTDDGF